LSKATIVQLLADEIYLSGMKHKIYELCKRQELNSNSYIPKALEQAESMTRLIGVLEAKTTKDVVAFISILDFLRQATIREGNLLEYINNSKL
jgi:hypothetical protein